MLSGRWPDDVKSGGSEGPWTHLRDGSFHQSRDVVFTVSHSSQSVLHLQLKQELTQRVGQNGARILPLHLSDVCTWTQHREPVISPEPDTGLLHYSYMTLDMVTDMDITVALIVAAAMLTELHASVKLHGSISSASGYS